jgi:hypothetical protein
MKPEHKDEIEGNFYYWWCGKKYNVSQTKEIHDLCLKAFWVGYKAWVRSVK